MRTPFLMVLGIILASPGAAALTVEYGECKLYFSFEEPHRCGPGMGVQFVGCHLEQTLYGWAGSDCSARGR